MNVMTTCVHHRHSLSGTVDRSDLAGIRKASGLENRESVHVGTQHDDGTLSVAQQTDDPSLANAGSHFIAGGTQVVCGHTGCPILLHRKLGMRMDVFVDC